jgi:predicted RNA-binding protein YlxR (DUF448 family)
MRKMRLLIKIQRDRMMKSKKTPQRRCVGCGQMKDKKQLLRVVRTKEEEYLIDETGRLNGRGAYLCTNSECYKEAIKKKGLERSYKQAIPSEIAIRLGEEIENIEQR